jgi:hypothetical protein
MVMSTKVSMAMVSAKVVHMAMMTSKVSMGVVSAKVAHVMVKVSMGVVSMG